MTERSIQLDFVALPNFMSAWAFDSVLLRGGGDSHICTALFNQKLITSAELESFNALTYWGLKNRESFTQ